MRGGGGLFNLEKTMVSVLHKELEYKVEKLKNKKFSVMQLTIRIKSELDNLFHSHDKKTEICRFPVNIVSAVRSFSMTCFD